MTARAAAVANRFDFSIHIAIDLSVFNLGISYITTYLVTFKGNF